MLRTVKLRRQFIFASHNANLPVLGDAEQIVVLRTSSGTGGLKPEASPELMGAIDLPAVRGAVEEILRAARTLHHAAAQVRSLKLLDGVVAGPSAKANIP